MKSRLFWIMLACFFYSSYSFSAYTEFSDIGRININGGLMEVQLSQSINPAGCVSSGWYVKDLNDPGADEMLAILLAAKVASEKVLLRVSDSTCVADYPTFDYVSIQ